MDSPRRICSRQRRRQRRECSVGGRSGTSWKASGGDWKGRIAIAARCNCVEGRLRQRLMKLEVQREENCRGRVRWPWSTSGAWSPSSAWANQIQPRILRTPVSRSRSSPRHWPLARQNTSSWESLFRTFAIRRFLLLSLTRGLYAFNCLYSILSLVLESQFHFPGFPPSSLSSRPLSRVIPTTGSSGHVLVGTNWL